MKYGFENIMKDNGRRLRASGKNKKQENGGDFNLHPRLCLFEDPWVQDFSFKVGTPA